MGIASSKRETEGIPDSRLLQDEVENEVRPVPSTRGGTAIAANAVPLGELGRGAQFAPWGALGSSASRELEHSIRKVSQGPIHLRL